MATLNASKWGYISSGNQSTFVAARDATTGTAIPNPISTNVASAIEFNRTAGRSRGTYVYRVVRAFYYFDTSGITGTVSSATINITGYSTTNANVIVVPSTAFSGDGSTNLAGADINNISFNTNYTNGNIAWSTSLNSITLLSTALSDIQNNDYFICAVLQFDNDYANTDTTSLVTYNSGISYYTNAYLDYTEAAAGPANVASFSGIAKANIASISGVSLAEIASISGVS